MESLIKKINSLNEELNSLKPFETEFQVKLDNKFRLEFSFNSNHIEGNTLTYGETVLLLLKDITNGENHTFREFEEMKAHDVAFQIIKNLAREDRILNENDIRGLNKIILVRNFWKDATTLDGQATRREIKVGEYKEFPNSVRLQNGEIFHYTSPIDTPIEMNKLMNWLNSEIEKNRIHPVELAAQFHFKFVRIHPFDDGNGRVSRLLMNYVLLKYDLPPVIIKSNDKKNYLIALNKADVGDLTAFSKYIAEQLIWSLEISIKAAKGENIDEPDDIDKELFLLDNKILNVNSPKLYRYSKIDAIPIKDSLVKLFEKLENHRIKFFNYYEDSKFEIDYGKIIENKFEYFKNFNDFILFLLNHKEEASDVTYVNHFFGLKYIAEKDVNYRSELNIFLGIEYLTISIQQKIYFTKYYNEEIYDDEINEIANAISKQHIQFIKQKIEYSK